MKRLAGTPLTSCARSNHCRASCSSSSTDHHRCDRGTTRSGCHSGYEGLYKTPPMPLPFEFSRGCILFGT